MIRYYSDYPDIYYWACNDENRVLFVVLTGEAKRPFINYGYEQFRADPKYKEFFYIDSAPIEDFYINATDNPYKDGFKYPDAGLEAL